MKHLSRWAGRALCWTGLHRVVHRNYPYPRVTFWYGTCTRCRTETWGTR